MRTENPLFIQISFLYSLTTVEEQKINILRSSHAFVVFVCSFLFLCVFNNIPSGSWGLRVRALFRVLNLMSPSGLSDRQSFCRIFIKQFIEL